MTGLPVGNLFLAHAGTAGDPSGDALSGLISDAGTNDAMMSEPGIALSNGRAIRFRMRRTGAPDKMLERLMSPVGKIVTSDFSMHMDAAFNAALAKPTANGKQWLDHRRTDMTEQANTASIRKEDRTWHFALGVFMILLGVAALSAPFMATLLVEAILGFVLLAAALALFALFLLTDEGWGARFMFLAVGIATSLAALFLLLEPLAGLLGLTLVITIYLFVSGILRMVAGYKMFPARIAGLVIAAGGVSVFIAIILAFRYPDISMVFLGVSTGISLVLEGLGHIGLGSGRGTALDDAAG